MTEDKTKESPDMDKTLELTDDKPPGMGTGEELVEGKEGKETTASITEQAEEEKLSPELEAIMKKKGFKDLDEFAGAYKALEKKETELEKDARLRSLAEVPPRPKTERTFTEVPALTKDPYDMSKEEFEDYQGKRERRFEEKMTAMYQDAEADKKWDREYREVIAVKNKDPERFEALKPTMTTIYREYPNAPIAELYSMADEREKVQSQKRKEGLIREVFGPNADVDKLKTLISKARPAVVSDAGGAGATGGTKTSEEKAKDAIWSGIEKADKRRE